MKSEEKRPRDDQNVGGRIILKWPCRTNHVCSVWRNLSFCNQLNFLYSVKFPQHVNWLNLGCVRRNQCGLFEDKHKAMAAKKIGS